MTEYTAPAIEARLQRSQEIPLRRPLRKQLAKGQLTNSNATLYTAPAAPTVANSVGVNPIVEIDCIWLCNTDSSARTFTLYLVESGGSAADNRAIAKTISIPAATSYELSPSKGFILEAAGTLQGLASVTTVITYFVFGTEQL